MASNMKHEAWLRFLKAISDVMIGRSKEDLEAFRSVAMRDHPSLVPVIEEYINLAARSDTGVIPQVERAKNSRPMHLFDLLRDKTLFPQNLDLSRFAARVVPDLKTVRHDKISRTDMAARIVEHIEGLDTKARVALEKSMREALKTLKEHGREVPDRTSFFSKWESIIKGSVF